MKKVKKSNIKKLQNNYTTAEQSNKLLELGLPEDSSDCYLSRTKVGKGKFSPWYVLTLDPECDETFSTFMRMGQHEYLPCWSVGRLIELLGVISVPAPVSVNNVPTTDIVAHLVDIYVKKAENRTLDFTKLET